MLATRDMPRMMVATPATISESEVGERERALVTILGSGMTETAPIAVK